MSADTKPRFKLRPLRRKGGRRFIGFSTLARMIFLSNLLGLIILIIGALTLNQFSRELVDAKVDSLTSQTRLITNLLGDQATGDGEVAVLDEAQAIRVIRRIDVPQKARIRLYDKNARLIADSDFLNDHVEVGALDPIFPETPTVVPKTKWWVNLQSWVDRQINKLPLFKRQRDRLQRHLEQDIKAALLGETISEAQYEQEDLIVVVAMPVKRVRDIQGVIVFETHDVDAILAAQRRGLTPIILIAIVASALSSVALTLFIALPVRQLARAAEQVMRSSKRRDAIPDLSARSDEIGDLSVVLRKMTAGLYSRIDDIANFAADVAHEIKNPLTSLRSASDTLAIAKTEAQRNKMIEIIKNDVNRMDRLITDISKASRMDAALAREPAAPLDIEKFLTGITDFYTQTRRETGVDVIMLSQPNPDADAHPMIVRALENSLGQVLRNLIDNALTFSPKATPKNQPPSIRLKARTDGQDTDPSVVITIDDDGPGISADNMEDIFGRFYTQRPDGTAFGSHSGLGLAICRQIMNAHHGTIKAANRQDKNGKIQGARFTLTLPLHTLS